MAFVKYIDSALMGGSTPSTVFDAAEFGSKNIIDKMVQNDSYENLDNFSGLY